MFCPLPQNYQHLFEKKIISTSYSKLSTEKWNWNLKGHWTRMTSYLFISYSIEDFKFDQNCYFQLILPMHFHFMRYFVRNIIFRVCHRLLYSVFIEVDFEK